MKASVLLLTFNEAANLPRCFDGLSWCDDIVVVDSGSTDETVVIALSRGARVLHRPFDNFAAQRNYGLEAAGFRHDWVLHLDADEVLTDAFVKSLESLTPPPRIDAYLVPSKLMLFGRWLRYSGMYPVYQARLGRRDVLRFKQVGHGQRETLTRDRLAVFNEPYLHFSFSAGIQAWLAKHVKYAADEALALLDERETIRLRLGALFSSDATERWRAVKALGSKIPLSLRPWFRFFYIYVVRRGFLDGAPGFTYASLFATYDRMIGAIVRDMRYERTANAGRATSARAQAQLNFRKSE